MSEFSAALLREKFVIIDAQPADLAEAEPLIDRARRVWDDLGCCNIAVVRGRDPAGSPEHAPYDVIFINGAVADIPAGLLDQLACGGRLVAVVKKPGSAVGGIVVTQKAADGVFSTLNVHDTAVPYAPGFEPAETFVF